MKIKKELIGYQILQIVDTCYKYLIEMILISTHSIGVRT